MDYELLDSGNKRRLERFSKFILNRPDPEAMWDISLNQSEWEKADAKYQDKWITKQIFPEKWILELNDLKIILKLTPFKHVGMFSEQRFEWDLIYKLLDNKSHLLNLFGYTGVASLFALKKGAKVTHVDASRPAITWFKENQKLSNLDDKYARIIIDDSVKFTQREIKRGNKYDAIIMDPPVYGHGPNGEKWSFNKDFPLLLDNCIKLLSDDPKLVIVNAYAISSSSTSIANIMQDKLKILKGNITHGELQLIEKSNNRTLSTGIYSIWQKN